MNATINWRSGSAEGDTWNSAGRTNRGFQVRLALAPAFVQPTPPIGTRIGIAAGRARCQRRAAEGI
jgi:hypothetical protein